MINIKSCQKGFTIIELLVVSVLLAIMAAILYGSISGILSGREIVESQRETTTLAQFVLERIGRDLNARALVPLTSNQDPSNNNAGGGFRGFGNRRYFLGKNTRESESDADSIRFVTNAVPQLTANSLPNFGMVEVEYRLEKPEERAESREDEVFILIREEVPAELANKEMREKRRRSVPVADNVVGLNFRYLVQGKWQRDWQSQSRPLPEAVEVTLRLKTPTNEVETFRTAYAVSKTRRTSRVP